MKSISYIFITISVICLAFWAYHESFKAKSALDLIKTVKSEINHAQEKLSVLRVEWAYLNRPDRLRALADLNFDKLMLIDLNTKHFGELSNIKLDNRAYSCIRPILKSEVNFGFEICEVGQ